MMSRGDVEPKQGLASVISISARLSGQRPSTVHSTLKNGYVIFTSLRNGIYLSTLVYKVYV
jgi:hypothetical protein